MSRPTALIADDNVDWRDLIAQVLQPEYEIAGFVALGSEVVTQAVTLQPDVITLDVSMPGISGIRLLPQLRAAMPDTVIVIVSMESSRLYVDEAYRRGADGYVAKSKTPSDLIPAIQDGAMRSHVRQERKA